jgi:hypothetical protein
LTGGFLGHKGGILVLAKGILLKTGEVDNPKGDIFNNLELSTKDGRASTIKTFSLAFNSVENPVFIKRRSKSTGEVRPGRLNNKRARKGRVLKGA